MKKIYETLSCKCLDVNKKCVFGNKQQRNRDYYRFFDFLTGPGSLYGGIYIVITSRQF